MAPLRRYLRISRFSILEVRIYLDTPADLHRWLLRSDQPIPILNQIITAVRPLVLPKLQEENDRGGNGKKKKGRGKGWKDTVVTEEFEVAVFLTERSSRHAILRKERRAKEKRGERRGVGTAGGRMTGSTRDEPVDVDGGGVEDVDGDEDTAPVGLRREDSEEEDGGRLADIPPAQHEQGQENDDDNEDKKKLALNTRYEGFSIYNRILCLVVKRKGGAAKGKEREPGGTATATAAGPATMMEDWISSTQMGEGGGIDD